MEEKSDIYTFIECDCSVMPVSCVYAVNPASVKLMEMVASCFQAAYKIDILTYKIGLAKRG
ncbi:hypothetical protein HDE69_001628 [Pedobacter cryoconitis]|uniref:Uncharacterized protein n=1 Tax=Pedobacter cryoconitis TaxID=188932 RepID=A0A7W8YRP8_9SPHI|nr:hypothetical protein [Pedobacter cryoconitis]MBB5620579.1 hypothetical protein [Pedobacter cryoconitis]MBB5646349.1 hypothetical protein [Pedobacter cryoconitis]